MGISFYARSTSVILSLWGLVFVLIAGVTYLITSAGGTAGDALRGTSPFAIAALIALIVVFLQFLISPFLLDLQLWWIYDMSWINPADLPQEMYDALMTIQEKYGFHVGKVGIIHDGMPNAFTYGHFRNNARVVLTEGIIDLLDPDERVAVLEHELGHIVHYDFVFMTVAQAVPLLLYYIYISSRSLGSSLRSKSSSSKQEGSITAGLYGVAFLSYVFYIISGYLVLLLSRYREHFADEFSALETRNPNALSSGLVKVAYGLVTDDARKQEELANKDIDRGRRRQLQRQTGYSHAMRTMGISDVNTAKGLVMQAYTKESEVSPEAVAAAASWDLSTPWAKFIELSSTHPLTGKRLKALDQLAPQVGQDPKYPDLGRVKPQESLWDEFFVDLYFYYGFWPSLVIFPLIALGFAILFGLSAGAGIGIGLLLDGALIFLRIGIIYPGSIDQYNNLDRQRNTVMEALTDVSKDGYIEASPIRGKPILLEGTVQGRGQPGMIFSEDFMLRDSTGFVVINYDSIIPFYNLWFGWRRVREMMGEDVVVVGWYHRHMRPIVKLHRLYRRDGRVHKNQWRGVNRFFGFLFIAIGILFMLGIV